MGISRILRLLLIIEIIVLLGNTIVISRDYQDSWILEGLEIPFAIFIITYTIYFFTEKKIASLFPFALICGFVMLLLPNLKYAWFQGVAVDQHHHYRLTQNIHSEGYIEPGELYSDTPLMHVFFSVHSLVTGGSALLSFKYVPVLTWIIYPLMTYVVMKRSTKNLSISKYALFFSSIPVKSGTSYIIIGTLYGALLSFLILSQFVALLKRNDRRDWIITLIFCVALAGTHSVSSIFMTTALITTYLMALLIRKFLRKTSLAQASFSSKPLFQTFMLIMLISLAWFSYVASTLFTKALQQFAPYIYRIMGVTVQLGTTLPGEPVPWRFFELNFIDSLKVLLVTRGGDIFFIFLILVGVVAITRKGIQKQSGSALMFFSLYVISLIFLLIAGFIFRIGINWPDRVARYIVPIAPIFCGVSLFYLKTRIHNKKLRVFIASLLIGAFLILAPIELYHCQPLVPSAYSFSKDLPKDEPLFYVNAVNTVYQRSMIMHAELYISEGMRFASDRVTQNQIDGLTSNDFSSGFVYYYPLSGEKPKKYDYFLIHLPGKGGAFSRDGAETCTKDLILEAIYNSSIVYTNGESYILTHNSK